RMSDLMNYLTIRRAAPKIPRDLTIAATFHQHSRGVSMHILTRRCVLFLLCLLITSASTRAQNNPESTLEKYKQGHSKHGEAYDVGPREKPWVMEGLSITHFPITTKNPEVQKWFDQGFTLLHSFWYYEAERAFRWCLKLEPECAMA